MEQLWEIRRKCMHVVDEFSFLLLPLLKFLVAYLAFSGISKQINYMPQLSNLFILLALSLISAVLPDMVMVMLAAALLILQSYSAHLFAGVFAVLMLLLLYIFLQRFSEKNSLLLVLTPLALSFGLAPIIPVAGGFLLGPAALIPICSGTIVYAVVATIAECAAAIHGVDVKEFTTVIAQLQEGITARTDTILVLIIMASVFLIVYALRRLSVPYAWQIALGASVVAYCILVMVGGFFMKTAMTVGNVLPGIIAAVLIGEGIIFFRCGLEYKNTSRLQFEDDDYYYYVKMVPKVDGNRPAVDTDEADAFNGYNEAQASARTTIQESAGDKTKKLPIDDLEASLEKAMRQIQE